MNLLGEIFWGYVHGVVAKLSSKFGWIWTSFARDSWFEGLFAGFLDETGQTVGETGQTGQSGFELPDRSDRSVCAVLRFVKFLSPLLPRCDIGLFLRDSLSIAILADRGSRACGDLGI